MTKCPLIWEFWNRVCYIFTIKYYAAVKKNVLMLENNKYKFSDEQSKLVSNMHSMTTTVFFKGVIYQDTCEYICIERDWKKMAQLIGRNDFQEEDWEENRNEKCLLGFSLYDLYYLNLIWNKIFIYYSQKWNITFEIRVEERENSYVERMHLEKCK